MSLRRVWRLFRKDMVVGPRSPFFLFALVMPVVITAVINLVFGELFSPTPRLGLVDEDHSELAAAAEDYAGVEVTRARDRDELQHLLAGNDVDVGWVLPADFDERLKSGDRPLVDIEMSGGSLASHRVLIVVAIADLLRNATPHTPVHVDVVGVGEGSPLPIETRLMPLMVLLAVMIAGILLTASSIVDEKSKGTLTAMLVTPMRMSEFLAAKGLLGFLLATLCGVVTLAMNGMLGRAMLPLLVILALAALMMAELGLILGSAVKNINILFSIWKGGTWPLMLPIIPYLWAAFPPWAAKLSPTYCFVDPAWRVTVEGAPFAAVAPTLAIGIGVCVALVPFVVWLGRRAALACGQS